MKRLLLCTDLDRTLIPNGEQAQSSAAESMFEQLVRREDVTLAYVTGRDRALIELAIAEYELPQPDYAIADVGSTIYQIVASTWRQWTEWDTYIAPDWQGLQREALYHLLAVFPALRLQEKDKQGVHKLSFYVTLEINSQELIAKMNTLLTNAGIKTNIIWSIDELGGVGLLDVLPARANKLHAIQFLMQQKNFILGNTVFAGDSGNDIDVLMSDIPAVLVANANPELKKRLVKSNKDTLHIAQGGYLGMNGNYCAGILEGVAHHIPEVDTWLRKLNYER